MRIDSYAHGNRWRQVHPGEKGLWVLLALAATLLSRHPGIPLLITVVMTAMTLLGAGIPLRGYLRLLAGPLAFLLWSCILLPVTLTPAIGPLLQLPGTELTIGWNAQELPMAQLVFCRSLGALSSLLFLTLTTPVSEVAGLLRLIGIPRLFVELTVIAYRQIFILLEAFSAIRSAQEARLGYRSLRTARRSMAEMAGNILIKTVTRARSNHQALLARGYDTELRFLSPQRQRSPRNLLAAGISGLALIALALQVQP